MKQVAVGIIMNNGKVLACQRRRTARYPLKWEFPGGKFELNETGEEALIRELREELAIEARSLKEFCRQEWAYPEGATDPETDGSFRVYYFLVNDFQGDPVNRVFEDIRWVTPGELLTMDILEGNRASVELLTKHAEQKQTA
jgi:8-oxo-dGTP diphosphatase